MEEKSYVATGGLTFTGALQIAFIVLKLCKVINWSWWLVMLPSLIPAAFFVILVLVVISIVIFMGGTR